jgi:exodeoxyribonuclease V beta subunit
MNFDLATAPLGKGVTRLEASAGTGKTFALAGIFLRLLLEERVSARDILVVTFTEAATAELRDRVRRRLSEARAVLEGQVTQDPLLSKLTALEPSARHAALLALRNALEVFDLVSIYTIHGFCQRTLQDSAFESGILFDMELVTDQEALLRETAADYCRNHLHDCDEVMASAALYAQLTPDILSRLLKQYLTYPELKLVTKPKPRPVETVGVALRASFKEVVDAWKTVPGGRAGLVAYFVDGQRWAIRSHVKSDVIELHAVNLEHCRDGTNLSDEFWNAVEFFSTSAIQKETGKGKQMPSPSPSLFAHCETLTNLRAELASSHHLRFLEGAGSMLAKRKQEAKQQSYDDLISRLATALDGPSGDALAESVRRRYRAALIDESQDTDPLQWKIFQRVFAGSTDHWLYLIGDPKQAIYGFRGADVHTYLQAAATAGHEYSLGTNWRSESALVHAVNALFSSAGRTKAFLEEKISFETVAPGPKADTKPILFPPDGQRPPPFHVWCWEPDGEAVTSKKAQKQLPVSVAAEISKLLTNHIRLGDNHWLQPRDIAILVESHQQARWMQDALHTVQIPSVEQAMESVFDSDEARELQWILAAILTPGRETSVKAALTTDALGINGAQLMALVANETQWQERLQVFAQYRQYWEEDGFFYMFVKLLRQEQVIENLLRFADAERRITNLLHVAELLEAACQAEHLGLSRLVQWLEERRLAEAAAPEEYQLRLESDEDAVQIVTIHRAKGLQYPVVFCPFVSKDAKLRQIKVKRQKVMDLVLYHETPSGTLSWDISVKPDEDNSRLAKREQLAEKVRLLYVALTRACNRCYLVSARYARNKSTALAWLLHRAPEAPASLMPGTPGLPNDPVAALEKESVSAGEWSSLWHEIAMLAKQHGGHPAIDVAELPIEKGQPWISGRTASAPWQARVCARQIERSWILSSFTQLAQQVSSLPVLDGEGGLPDRDELTAVYKSAAAGEEVATAATGIFALPGGAQTGDCFHKILEHLDFEKPVEEATRLLVRQQLEASNLWDEAHAAAISGMLDRLRHVPLARGQPNFTLAHVPLSHRLTEMEFIFPTNRLDARQLLAFIRNPHPGDVSAGAHPSITVSRLQGFLKGFIDLVFLFEGRYHLIDWKSNLLGTRVEDYTQEAMKAEVLKHGYDLQYHIYTVAVDRFLRQRLPNYDYELHFGGVHYLFLRGLDPNRPELGVFNDRPSAAVIGELSLLLGNFNPVQP